MRVGRGHRRYACLIAVAITLVIVWALNASRVGTRVEGWPQGYATVGNRRDGPLRVMSMNVLHGFPRFARVHQRLDLIAEEILRQDADIVCLQEVPWTISLGSGAQYLGERTGMNYLYLRANGNKWTILFEEGEAILSRYPLQEIAFAELKPRAGFFEHRVVLKATAATPWGEVRVFVTHLTNGDPQVNRGQADSLMALVETSGEGLAVVAGDFNATEDSPQIKAMTQEWVDTHRAANPEDKGFTCCIDDLYSGVAESLEKRIDYVFLVPGAQHGVRVVSSQRVLDQPAVSAGSWQWASDHVGLLVAICLQE